MTERFAAFILLLLLGLSAMTAFGQDVPKTPSIPVDDEDVLNAVLTVNPQEIDLGDLAPGEAAKGTFYLKNAGSGNLEWFAEGPEGWTLTENQILSGVVGQQPEPLRIHLVYVKEVGPSKKRGCVLLLRLESGGLATTFRREVPVGDLRESIGFNYDGGMRTVSFHVKLAERPSAALLEVEPLRMDFGTVRPGEQITKRIRLTNRGREPLKWKAGVAGARGMPAIAQPPAGRYISFRSEAAGTGGYSLSGQLREGLELSGTWAEEGGYPSGQGERNVLRYRFTGTGISLCFWKSPDGGPFSVFFDEQFAGLIDGYAERRERGEVLIIDGQPEGPHLLSIISGEGKVTLEGLRIFGKLVQKGPHRWISVFPDSGMTTRETDYINVAVNTRQLLPGIYGDRIFFTSNGDDADVEVFLEVAAETMPRFLDVHRYLAGSDYLYTTNPQAEASLLQSKGYRHVGIAFRLFAPGTPGTIDFFRWFNPAKGDHYYSYDPKGGKPLPGYLFEGAIGNIATSRLAGTRELYRWFNPAKNGHFYTTDQAGEGLAKKGYRFEGIAGFVR
ncbi:MAG: hypothetical protein NT047_04295 [Deltaproteobacteria bacterium]|nr:hypothetical protein [Deltaproteobacteria bacterium]